MTDTTNDIRKPGCEVDSACAADAVATGEAAASAEAAAETAASATPAAEPAGTDAAAATEAPTRRTPQTADAERIARAHESHLTRADMIAQAAEVDPVDPDGPVELAVYDFDGTCIKGNSPVMLVKHLALTGQLTPSVIMRILLWGAAYKFRLPQNESWVRGLVFTAFEGRPVEEVDAFLRSFYEETIEHRFRPEADASMRAHKAAGRVVMVVSASFNPVIQRACEAHPFDYQLSTRMKTDDEGRYTSDVEGLPVEGAEKPRAIADFADAKFGPGNWKLAYAYGDHHSDRPMLAAATHPVAVSPDRPLLRTAKREGWDVVEWV